MGLFNLVGRWRLSKYHELECAKRGWLFDQELHIFEVEEIWVVESE